MRVGLDGIPLAELKTGIGHYTFELARALARAAPADEFELVSPVPFFNSGVSDLDEQSPSNLRLVRRKVNSLWWTIGLPLHVKQAAYSIFHGTNYDVPLWKSCPTILSIHDLSLFTHPETHLQHLVRRARRRLPIMARAATMIITATESVKGEICEHLRIAAGKVAVTAYAPRSNFSRVPPVRTVEVRRRLGVEDQFVLFVGTIEPRKNLITLVRAFDEVLRMTTLRPQLVIAGKEGWLTEELFSEIGKLGIGDRLRFTGYLSEEDLCALYSSCQVCVYPSLYEGFGLPPLEAMACGAPVITSRIPSITETVGSAASLIAPTDAQALAQSIIELLKDQGRRRSLSSAGLQRAAEFSWERTARLTLAVYHEALKREGKFRSADP